MAKTVQHPTSNQLLGSLAQELKTPLTLIARHAELEGLNTENKSFYALQDTAEQAMKLIDGYLLMAQSEYGQASLPLQTIGVGSVIYDVIEEFRPYAKENKFIISSEINDDIVMTHPEGLRTALWCMVRLAADHSSNGSRSEIFIKAGRAKDKSIAVSVLSGFEVTKRDIDLARELQGKSHLSASMTSHSSGIQLAIADILTSSIGASLKPAKGRGLTGLSMKLLKSQQLQLV